MLKKSMAKGTFSISVLFAVLFFSVLVFLFFYSFFIMQLSLDKSLISLYYSEIGVTKKNDSGIGFAEKNIFEKRILSNTILSKMEIKNVVNNYSISRLVYDGDSKIMDVVFIE